MPTQNHTFKDEFNQLVDVLSLVLVVHKGQFWNLRNCFVFLVKLENMVWEDNMDFAPKINAQMEVYFHSWIGCYIFWSVIFILF